MSDPVITKYNEPITRSLTFWMDFFLKTYLSPLAGHLHGALKQLGPLDSITNHDAVLTIEQRRAAGAYPLDHVKTRLQLSVFEMEKSLTNAKRALAAVTGIFRGEEKDRIEELLARGVRSDSDRLQRLREIEATYVVPDKPYGIRIATLVVVSTMVDECVEYLKAVCFGADNAKLDATIVDELNRNFMSLMKIQSILTYQREHAGSKVTQPLNECLTAVMSIVESMRATADRVRDNDPEVTVHCTVIQSLLNPWSRPVAPLLYDWMFYDIPQAIKYLQQERTDGSV